MNILITGAAGFIGSAIVELLLQEGHSVKACARNPHNLPRHPNLKVASIDFSAHLAVEDWLPHIQQIDAVINCAGILTERYCGEFSQLHFQSPKALAEACVQQGITRFIQLSALGKPKDGEFIKSKHQFDDYLYQYFPSAVIVRPSVVFSCSGSYGGTSLLRAIASLPIIPLVNNGQQQLQPILLEDLAQTVLKLLIYNGSRQTFYPAGPDVLTIKEFILLIRQWLKWKPPLWLNIPSNIFTKLIKVNNKLNIVPFNSTLLKMLEHGNIIPSKESQVLVDTLHFQPKSLKDTLMSSASFVQDRWHAKLYWVKPILFTLISFIWILSAIAGFTATPEQYSPILNAINIPYSTQAPLVLSSSILDLTLAILFILRWQPKLILCLMLLSVLSYTLVLGVLAPFTWLDPLGGLLKNLAVISSLWVYWIITDSR
ncbi:SDR family oxidoreductase [Zooshikella sp. RANM57]|uniref:SDR family oxidoreductase n=1 Tax=Zooshikella sp. RANM57 TaxID=3425863 RepID=UPI003D6EC0E9